MNKDGKTNEDNCVLTEDDISLLEDMSDGYDGYLEDHFETTREYKEMESEKKRVNELIEKIKKLNELARGKKHEQA